MQLVQFCLGGIAKDGQQPTDSEGKILARVAVALVFVALVILDCLLNGIKSWHYAFFIAALPLLIYGTVQSVLFDLRRKRAFAAIKARDPSHLPDEYREIACLVPAEMTDIERVWHAMSRAYSLPAEKLRSGDSLDGELKAVVAHPDCDLLDGFADPSAVQKSRTVEWGTTWGELVAAILRIEASTGVRYGSQEQP